MLLDDLKAVFGRSPSFLAVLRGPDHVFAWANDAYLELIGRSDIIGKPLLEVLPEIKSQGFRELLDGVLATGIPYLGRDVPVNIVRGPDGRLEQAYVDFIYQPLVEPDGSRSGVVVHGSVVTEKVRAQQELHLLLAESESATIAVKDSERQWRTMLDAMPALAWTARADGFIDWYNARWYEYTGKTPEDIEGWGWQSVHDPEVLPEVLERWQASIATGEPFKMTFPLRRRDGVFKSFLTRVSPVKDSGGKVIRWFGTNTDVESEHRALESAENAERRSAYLSEISAALAGSLDVRVTLETVARLAVPQLADWCFIELVEENGAIRPAAIAHRDPEKVA
ncbi:MAG TPA: PAS domain-containing protein, partial [Gemmatimonadaceae bacterium]|nr:PAS domain-containing protein [Gemmatimonadaceae bacterium]